MNFKELHAIGINCIAIFPIRHFKFYPVICSHQLERLRFSSLARTNGDISERDGAIEGFDIRIDLVRNFWVPPDHVLQFARFAKSIFKANRA